MREIWAQIHLSEVDHHLASMLEIHRDAVANGRLHLPQPPIRLQRMPHQHARFQNPCHLHLALLKERLVPEKPDLAALVGSRICHDLISPIGAIGNGVELMLMEPGSKGPEMALITESVAHANARIRFFRIAFGAAGPDQRIGRNEVTAVISDVTHGGRVTIDWASPADLPRRDIKLVFLLILCLETALPYGGRISIDRNDTRWSLQASAAKMKIDPGLWECLINPAAAAEIGPAQVQFLLVPEEITRQHRRLTTELAENQIRLSF
jgi:histidine phosphotransferase ChpT